MSEDRLTPTLRVLAGQMAAAQDRWWLIGSAAVKLHGGDPGTIGDVDVIVSRRDLDGLFERLPLTDTREAGKPMFLSDRFGCWADPPLNVEFMAGLTLREKGEWRPVQPQTRQGFDIGGAIVFAPEREELIAMLHRFGRGKDLVRAASLQRD